MTPRKNELARIARVYFGDNPGSLSSKKKFASLHPEFSKADVDKFFASDYVTRLHFPQRQHRAAYVQRNVSRYFGHRIQVDLAFFEGKRKTVFVCSDVETKYLSVRLIPDRSSSSTAAAFKAIFERDYLPFLWLPRRLGQCSVLTDKGLEFTGEFLKLCSSLMIDAFRLKSSVSKANLTERLIRLLRSRNALLETRNPSDRDLNARLQLIAIGYNKTPNVQLGRATPYDLRARNPEAVKLYDSVRPQFDWKDRQAFFLRSVKKFSWLKPGVWVRVANLGAKTFEKISARPANKLEIFRVRYVRWPSIENRSLYPYVALSDALGREIEGMFRSNEILKTDGRDPTQADYPGTLSYVRRVGKAYEIKIAGKFIAKNVIFRRKNVHF
jgi:hypothetical protein